jgi:hypothetical protein
VVGVNTTLPATSATVPPIALPTAAIVSGLPSTSLSLPSSVPGVNVLAVSSAVVNPPSSAATGASFTAVTVTLTVPLAVPVPFDTV